MHDSKIIHRDLKPLNIVVQNGYLATIVDYGTCL